MEVLPKVALSLLCCQGIKSHPVIHRGSSECPSSPPLQHHQAEERCCTDVGGQYNLSPNLTPPSEKEENKTKSEKWLKFHIYIYKLNNIYLLLKHVLPILERNQAILFRLMVVPSWWSLEIHYKILQALCYLLNRQVDRRDVFLLTKTIQFPDEKHGPILYLAMLSSTQIYLQVHL